MNALVTDVTQNVGKVKNPDCIPLTQEDAHLINEKQKFMHSVFSTDLQTEPGKKFVREN